MDFHQVIQQIEQDFETSINQGYSQAITKRFLIDTQRLGERLVSDFNQNLSNIQMTPKAIASIALEPISLSQYAEENDMIYGTLFQNRTLYRTLVKIPRNQNNTYTVARYELKHSLRSLTWGDKTEHLVNQNKDAQRILPSLCKKYGTGDIGVAIYRLIMDQKI